MKGKSSETDIYIKPDIKEFSVVSFDEAEAIIVNGKKAALTKLPQLKALANRQQRKQEEVIIAENSQNLVINQLSIAGTNRYTRSYIKGKLKLKTPSVTTYEKLNEGINNLSATGNFDRVTHRLIDTDKGKQLLLNVKESDDKMLLRFAIHYDDLYQTAALINITKKNLLFNNDVLSGDLALGDNIRYNLDYYIDKGFHWSTGLKFGYTSFNKGIDFDFIGKFGEIPDLDINTIDISYKDYTLQGYAETLLKQNFSIGFGAEYKRLQIISDTFGEDENQIPRTVFDNSDYWSALGYIKFDTYDNKYFPTTGVLFTGDFHTYLFSSNFTNSFEEFSIAKGKLGYAVPITDRLSFNTTAEAGAKIGALSLNSLDFLLGGFGAQTVNNIVPFYGYDFLELSGQSFATALLSFDYRMFKHHHINVAANYANIGDILFSTGRWFELPEFSGYALGYGLETFLGPIQVKYSYSPEIKESNVFFSLGFWF